MHMHARQNQSLKTVLNMREFLGEIPHMMVIDERNGADRFLVLDPFLADEIVPNQIPQGFRAVRVLPACDEAVKLDQQVVVQGHAEPNEFLHLRTSDRIDATNSKFVAPQISFGPLSLSTG